MDEWIARNFIGKRIRFDVAENEKWSAYAPYKCAGVLTEIKGQNALVDGQWRWLPDIYNVRVVKDNGDIAIGDLSLA